VLVKVNRIHNDSAISQHFYQVDDFKQSMNALRLLLLKQGPESSLVFCNTKKETFAITEALTQSGFSALTLNGDLEQWERDQTMVRFANKSISILVATDVAARGLDVDALDAVFNFQLPHEPETYLHRIGRTGRAGSQGEAFTLHNGNEYKLTMLSDFLKQPIHSEALPDASLSSKHPFKPLKSTLQISGGKKQKVRPGDILGALTAGSGITGKQVGKIHILDNWAYVAVNQPVVKIAIKKLGEGKLKGRSFRVRLI